MRACSASMTSMITPPLSILAIPILTSAVPVVAWRLVLFFAPSPLPMVAYLRCDGRLHSLLPCWRGCLSSLAPPKRPRAAWNYFQGPAGVVRGVMLQAEEASKFANTRTI